MDPKLGCGDNQKLQEFVSVIRMVVSNRLCSVYELNCRLETDTMLSCGLITQDFTKMMIRTNTKRHYAQSKFNLLRDENEGYAKLLSFLHQPVINPSTLKESISSFIGIFCLDPNRVLDILLDACEFEPSKYTLFKTLFGEFKVSEIPHFVEFKFSFYKSHNVRSNSVRSRVGEAHSSVSSPIRDSLAKGRLHLSGLRKESARRRGKVNGRIRPVTRTFSHFPPS